MALSSADLSGRLLDQAVAHAMTTSPAEGATWYAQQLCTNQVPEQLARGLMERYAAALPANGTKYGAAKAVSALRQVYAAGKAQAMGWKLSDEPKGAPLGKSDIAALERSWIDADLASAACLRRVTDEEGRAIVGADKRRGNMAGIVFPYVWPGTARVRDYRLRRDKPDVEATAGNKRKEINKYLSPPGRANMLYFPPATDKTWLQDAALPIIITEGEKKALALSRLARMGKTAGFPLRFLPVGLAGVWNWRGTTGKTSGPDGERLDEKGVIADMQRIVWTERRVVILFDANVRSNDSVQAARRELARWLVNEQRAEVLYAELPAIDGLNGVDDYLAAHGPERAWNIIRRAKPCPFKPKSAEASDIVADDERDLPKYSGEKYILDKRGLLFWRRNKEGFPTANWLTNFPATIIADVVRDDGETTTRALKIRAKVRGHERDVIVTAPEFALMNWPIEQLGTSAIVYPNFKDHARTAMQELSRNIAEQYVYQHTGWTEIKGEHVYLHGGGGIGAQGVVPGLAVELEREIRHYALPEPPRGRELRRAIEASLMMLDVAPDRVSLPIYCAVWRSVLGICDVSVHLAGQTGSGKSQIAALAQQHFGQGMDAKHLPASWDSTANSLQAICFFSKNAITVVDDFVPKGAASDVARLHREADRLLRAQGNHAGRQRMSADGRIKPPRTPRGIILSTGEDVPKGNSLRARLVVIEMDPQDMRWDVLTECQRQAGVGAYAEAMSSFVQWVSSRMPTMPQRIFEQLSAFREQWGSGNGHHMRTPDNLANLNCGLEVFLDFAREAGAITERKAAAIADRAQQAFADAAEAQDKAQSHAEPTQQFLELVCACLTSGQAHLVSRSGEKPSDLAACGWKFDGGEWRAQGPKIGWEDDEHTYLDPKPAFAAAQHMGKEINDAVPVSIQTLGRRLKQREILASTDESRETTTVRKSVEGRRVEVWHILTEVLYGRK